MNKFELIRRKINNKRREMIFRKKSKTPNFKLLPGWLLKEIPRDPSFVSQAAQDWFVATYLYPNKTDGFFLDIGANHPLEINNSLYFEKIGWTGLAFEPQENLCSLWKNLRTTSCVPYLLGSEEKLVSFHVNKEHTLSSVVETGKGSDTKPNCISLQQRRLDLVLQKKSIHHVDYMSVDVEGYEKDVLDGIDFSKITIDCIVLENDEPRFGNEALREYMQTNGYRYIARLCGDDVFVRNGSSVESHYLNQT